jgi:hypothetical protein
MTAKPYVVTFKNAKANNDRVMKRLRLLMWPRGWTLMRSSASAWRLR